MATERLWEQDECYFEKDGHARIFTLNRPQVLNSYSGDIIEGLFRAANEVRHDLEVSALIITGAGRAFSTGANVKNMAGVGEARTQMPTPGPEGLSRGAQAQVIAAQAREAGKSVLGFKDREHIKYRHKRWAILREIETPVIAAVNGWAIGAGLDIAMACDIIIASEDAKFGYFYSRVGMVTDMGGAWYLPRLVGTYRAMELILTGDAWDANEARLMGLCGKVVPAKELLPTAIAMAEKIATSVPEIIRMDKDLIYKSMDLDFRNWMDYLVCAQVVMDTDEDITKARKEAAKKHLANRERPMQKGPQF